METANASQPDFCQKSRKLPFFRIATIYIDLIKLLNSVINS